jgi:hypothetical protein
VAVDFDLGQFSNFGAFEDLSAAMTVKSSQSQREQKVWRGQDHNGDYGDERSVHFQLPS